MHVLGVVHLPSVQQQRHLPKPAAPARAGSFCLAQIPHQLQRTRLPSALFFLGHRDVERTMPVWSSFLLVCLVSDEATGKKGKVLRLQPSSGGLTRVV